MKPTPFLILAVALTACGTAQAQEDAAAMIARIEAPQTGSANPLAALSLPALMERLHVPGASIAVIKDFKIHWAKAYGVADAGTGRPVTTETRFQSASIAKPVTAMAAMRMVQERRLDLDADVNAVLKSWQAPRGVTPRSLFSHTSGADDGFGFPGYTPGAPLPTIVQILDGQAPSNVGKVTFARAPYQAYKYSGGGGLVMQQALTDLSGQPFAQFMQAAVLEPLQMSHSTFGHLPEDGAKAQAALAHDELGQRMGAPWRVHPELATSNLWTTASDLAAVIIELQTALRGPQGKILQQRSAREMVTPVGVGRYGVGLAIDRHGEGWYFSHNGSNWGYRAWMSGHVRKGYGLVILVNGENGMPLLNQVAERVEQAYRWDSSKQ